MASNHEPSPTFPTPIFDCRARRRPPTDFLHSLTRADSFTTPNLPPRPVCHSLLTLSLLSRDRHSPTGSPGPESHASRRKLLISRSSFLYPPGSSLVVVLPRFPRSSSPSSSPSLSPLSLPRGHTRRPHHGEDDVGARAGARLPLHEAYLPRQYLRRGEGRAAPRGGPLSHLLAEDHRERRRGRHARPVQDV